MRISDWSSDVCSSDLEHRIAGDEDEDLGGVRETVIAVGNPAHHIVGNVVEENEDQRHPAEEIEPQVAYLRRRRTGRRGGGRDGGCDGMRQAGLGHDRGRSEEHTSELQSLMRISYAVCCLKITNT